MCLILSGCNVSVSTGSNQQLPEPTAGTAAQRGETEKAARHYLGLIDEERYEDTWTQSGSALREMTSEFMWVNSIKLTHKLFGTPPDRSIEGFGFSPRIDANVPVGEYVLVQFKSTSGQTVATEKVVLQKEVNAWKIIGYFVEKRTTLTQAP